MIRGSIRKYLIELLKNKAKIRNVRQLGTVQANDIIIPSPYEKIFIPNTTVDQYVFNNISKWSSKIALVDGIDGHKLTYAQLRDRSRALAIKLQKNFNLKCADTIAVCLFNSPEYPVVILGALEAAMVVTTINPIYTADEIARQLVDCDSKVLFGHASMHKQLEEAVSISKKNIKLVYLKDSQEELIPSMGINFNDLVNTSGVVFKDLIVHDLDRSSEVAFLPYSSGTTGLPKGVMLSHTNIIANCEMVNADLGAGRICKSTDDYQDVFPCVLPFFHIYGLVVSMLSKLEQGGKLVTLPKFKPDTYLKAISEHKATVLYAVPPIIIFLGQYDMFKKKHAETIRVIMSGAAPISKTDAEMFINKAPNVHFAQGYGLTECSPCTIISFDENKNNFSTIGKPVPETEAKIVEVSDPTFKGVGPNISGELLVRGPHVMKGYHNNPKATKETLTDDGWLRTGDIGHYDEDHYFYITDRLKELIKVKGFQVAPAELEGILRSHPKIADAAVIGIPDKVSGELPRAYLVKHSNQEVTEAEIKDFVAKHVAVYKKLEGGVEFIDTIPKNSTGKIMRRALKEKFGK